MVSFRLGSILFGNRHPVSEPQVLVRCGHCAKPWPCTSAGKLSGWQHLFQVGDFFKSTAVNLEKVQLLIVAWTYILWTDVPLFCRPMRSTRQQACPKTNPNWISLSRGYSQQLTTVSYYWLISDLVFTTFPLSHQTTGEAVPLKSFGECQYQRSVGLKGGHFIVQLGRLQQISSWFVSSSQSVSKEDHLNVQLSFVLGSQSWYQLFCLKVHNQLKRLNVQLSFFKGSQSIVLSESS